MRTNDKYMLVALTEKGSKQLSNMKDSDHIKYMSDSSSAAFNKALEKEGLMYVKLGHVPVENYYGDMEIAGEGYEEIQVDKMFDKLFMQ